MVLRVRKKNGKLQKFKAEKIIRACVRAGSTKTLAREIASKVRKKVYDKISTRVVRKLVVKLLGKRLGEAFRKFRKKRK